MASKGDDDDNNDDGDDDLYGDLDFSLDRKKPATGTSRNRNPPLRPTGTGCNNTDRKRGSLPFDRGPDAAQRRRRINDDDDGHEKGGILLAKQKLEILRAENLRLKRNIGTLFRTAKHEMKRKDDRIERLQRQLEELQQQQNDRR